MHHKLSFDVSYDIQAQDKEQLLAGLRGYNSQFMDYSKRHNLGIFIRDEQQQMLGGIMASIVGLWLCIDILWVDEKHRALRLGSQLMAACEKEALAKGCHFAMLDTFSFQALAFYQKHGYELKMSLAHFPSVEHTRHYLTKALDTQANDQV